MTMTAGDRTIMSSIRVPLKLAMTAWPAMKLPLGTNRPVVTPPVRVIGMSTASGSRPSRTLNAAVTSPDWEVSP